MFWVFVVGLGIVIPLFIQTLAVSHRIAHTPIAPLLVLAGGLALRFVIVYAGQVQPLGKGVSRTCHTSSHRGRQLRTSNPYLAGIGLGLVLLAAFVFVGRGLGASGAVSAAVTAVLHAVAPDHAHSLEWLSGRLVGGDASPLKDWLVIEVVGVVLGGFLGALWSGRFKATVEKGPRISVRGRLACALAGGALMGIAAGLARGCTSGQALSGGALLDTGSWAFMMMVFAGGYAFATFMRWQWR